MGNRVHAGDGEPKSELETYSALINMGFSEEHSLMAAKKFPKNIHKAMDFVQQWEREVAQFKQKLDAQGVDPKYQQHQRYAPMNKNDEQKQNEAANQQYINECNGQIAACPSIQRTIDSLKFCQQITYNHEDAATVKKFETFVHKQGSRIINDYHHILYVHLNEDTQKTAECNRQFEEIYAKMMDANLVCDMSLCQMYTRHNRQREMRVIPQSNTEQDAVLPFYIDLLYQIHSYFIHSVDLGYRMVDYVVDIDHADDEAKEPGDVTNSFVDKQLKSLRSVLSERRVHLQRVRGRDRVKRNKFMTNILSSNTNAVRDQQDDEKTDENAPGRGPRKLRSNTEIQGWFFQSIKLDETDMIRYYQLFIKAGYYSVAALKDVNEEFLIELGIENAQHRAILMSEFNSTAGQDSPDEAEDEGDEQQTDEMNHELFQERNYHQYWFGARYDYWGLSDLPHRNSQHHRDDEYEDYSCKVKAKYDCIKMEVTCNSIYSIPIDAFNEAWIKSTKLLSTSHVLRKMKPVSLQTTYERFGPLTDQDILALVLYTDYDVLSSHFRQTFLKTHETDSVSDVALRNREFFNWSKILIEAVNCYGIQSNKSQIAAYYHATSMALFDRTVALCNVPLSTTTNLPVAIMFANDNGLIVELQASGTMARLRYFNSSFVSCYGYEDERIFVQPPSTRDEYALQFGAIRDLNHDQLIKQQFHRDFMKTCSELQKLITNNSCNMNDACLSILYQLGCKDTKFPEYVAAGFMKWAEKQFKIRVNVNYVPQQLAQEHAVKKLLSASKICAIFPNIECIQMYGTNNIPESEWYEYLVSISEMVSAVNTDKECKLREIRFMEIQNLGTAQLSSFKAFSEDLVWNFEVRENYDRKKSLVNDYHSSAMDKPCSFLFVSRDVGSVE